MTERKPKDDVASLQSQLRRLDDLAAKGLMRPEEAEEARKALRKRLLQAVIPDEAAPRVPWRVRLWAVVAMVGLVAALSAYLLSGNAGLRRQSLEAIDAAKAARARREAAQSRAFALLRAEKARAGSTGAVPESTTGAAGGSASAASGGAAEASATTTASDAAPAALLSGRVELAPALRGATQPSDSVFILVRLPADPGGLPLAALRRTVADLPLTFTVRAPELVGDERRFLQAQQVIVTARVSKSGSGRPQPGDLAGTTLPVAPWSGGVVVVIDRALP
jgi:cytochrome c-type biogenesis protein CcmH